MSSNKITSIQVKYDYVYFLKFIAILLITNSHFKPIYYGGLCKLAFGGAMGCAIFFFVSGYTLANGRKDNFFKWIGKRYLRIYPTVWLYYLVLSLVNGSMVKGFSSWLFLESVWFLSAIVAFYFLFFFISKYLSKWYLPIAEFCMIMSVLIYFMIDHQSWMIDYVWTPERHHWFYYFAFMLIGAWLKQKDCKMPKGGATIWMVLFFISFIGTYGIKMFCERFPVYMNLQLLFPIGLLLSTVVLFIGVQKIDLGKGVFYTCVKFVAAITLEMYIVQSLLIRYCSAIQFPQRLLIVIVLIIFCAWALHRIVGKFVNPLIDKIK